MDSNISVTENNIHIEDSYKTTSRETMRRILEDVKFEYPNCNSFKRSFRSLTAEWRAHNLLYSLNIEKDRTKDSDLDYPTKWYTEIGYAILSFFYYFKPGC